MLAGVADDGCIVAYGAAGAGALQDDAEYPTLGELSADMGGQICHHYLDADGSGAPSDYIEGLRKDIGVDENPIAAASFGGRAVHQEHRFHNRGRFVEQ